LIDEQIHDGAHPKAASSRPPPDAESR